MCEPATAFSHLSPTLDTLRAPGQSASNTIHPGAREPPHGRCGGARGAGRSNATSTKARATTDRETRIASSLMTDKPTKSRNSYGCGILPVDAGYHQDTAST